MPIVVASRSWTGVGTPSEFGRILAGLVLDHPGNLREMTVDLRDLPGALLIGNLFSGFLQRIHDSDSSRLEDARAIRWVTNFDFQLEGASGMMRNFIPRKD